MGMVKAGVSSPGWAFHQNFPNWVQVTVVKRLLKTHHCYRVRCRCKKSFPLWISSVEYGFLQDECFDTETIWNNMWILSRWKMDLLWFLCKNLRSKQAGSLPPESRRVSMAWHESSAESLVVCCCLEQYITTTAVFTLENKKTARICVSLFVI